MDKKIKLKDIIEFLGTHVINVFGDIEHISIKYLKPIDRADEKTLDWINETLPSKQELTEKSIAPVIITDRSVKYSDIIKTQQKVLIHVNNPKLAIALIGNNFFSPKVFFGIHPTAVIHPQAIIGENVTIGPHTYIGKSIIGNHSSLLGNNFIDDGVKIGCNVEIQAGVIIGNEGHNYIVNEKQERIKFPHIGGVIIEDRVEIGGNTFISRGVLSDTIIKSGTKIAQLVYIGANVQIGPNCAIRPNVMISGSVIIGSNVVLAPSSTIREHKILGNNVFIGLGAVVTKDVPENETWVGIPAKKIIK